MCSDLDLTAEVVLKTDSREVAGESVMFSGVRLEFVFRKRLLCCPTQKRSLQICSVTSFNPFPGVSAVRFYSELTLRQKVVSSIQPFDTKYALSSVASYCLLNAPLGAALLST